MNLLGVSRGGEFSPNMQGSDEAIFRAVASGLTDAGFEVECCSETEYVTASFEADAIFTMARSAEALSKLLQAEAAGTIVVNSPRGILNAVRRSMTEKLLAASVPHPESWIVDSPPSELPSFGPSDAFWIKRADGCAQVADDVCFVTSFEQLAEAIERFRSRGIAQLVINRHLEGDLVKFYGVQGTPFFHCYYPSEGGHSKFGLEAINGLPQHYPFSGEQLKREADRAALVLSVPVYGGDCIVAPDGSFSIIDFNDWPSFSCCREEAARAICQYICQTIKTTRNE